MRKTALVLNSIVVIFFACFLAYTLFARPHIDNLARGVAVEKTLDYSEPIVNFADESLNVPFAQKLLAEDQASAVRREIADYRKDAKAYVLDLTRHNIRKIPGQEGGQLLVEVAAVKEKIRDFYDSTLNALIRDLRIFSVSNLIVGLVAFVLVYGSYRTVRQSLVWFSFMMFVTVLYCSCLYIDDLTFFRILFRTHMGWWYPVLLSVMIYAMYLDCGHQINATKKNNVHPTDEYADS